MNGTGSNSQDMRQSFAKDVVLRLKDAGFEALWAGGCVRDLLRGEAPTDYDVATSARPEQVRSIFGHRRTLPVGASFGVIIVLGPTREHGQVEVATFRTDATYSDGRHPDGVTYSTPQHDAQRRDFTINGMFYDPLHHETIDFVGGRCDLQKRVVRAIGDAGHRIAEDKLRMLRAIRFAARFQFAIDPDTYSAIRRHAAEIAVVSRERMATEMRKTLTTSLPAWAVERWAESGLLNVLLPPIATVWLEHQSELTKLLDRQRSSSWTVPMSCLLWPLVRNLTHSQAIELVNQMGHQLRLANDETEEMCFILNSQSTLQRAESESWSQLQPILADTRAVRAIELIEARAQCGDVPKQTGNWLRQKLELSRAELDPPPLITGQDLIACGLRPGPEFSRLLRRVRQYQLDGQIRDKKSALEWISNESTRNSPLFNQPPNKD